MSPRFSAAFDRVRHHVVHGPLPSAVLGVANRNGIVALDAFGSTGDRRARVDDRFHLFSVTKPLVGITAARAIERGPLTPETPLTEALPSFGAQRDDVVRLRHLASHTSGISEPALDSPAPLRDELLAQGRDFAAGSASRYSSLAFEGIAALIEHADGRPWDAQLREWAVDAGAESLSLDADDAHPVVDADAAGLDMAAFQRLRHPGAGLSGRAQDLLHIGIDLLRTDAGARDGILAPSTLAMMRRALTGEIPRLEPHPPERGIDWGFTWTLPRRAPGLIDRTAYGHRGWSGTELWIHPDAGLCWVLLTNRVVRDGVDADAIANAIISDRAGAHGA